MDQVRRRRRVFDNSTKAKQKINLYVDDLRDCPEGYQIVMLNEEGLLMKI